VGLTHSCSSRQETRREAGFLFSATEYDAFSTPKTFDDDQQRGTIDGRNRPHERQVTEWRGVTFQDSKEGCDLRQRRNRARPPSALERAVEKKQRGQRGDQQKQRQVSLSFLEGARKTRH